VKVWMSSSQGKLCNAVHNVQLLHTVPMARCGTTQPMKLTWGISSGNVVITHWLVWKDTAKHHNLFSSAESAVLAFWE